MKNILFLLFVFTLSPNTYADNEIEFLQNCNEIKSADQKLIQIQNDAFAISDELGKKAFMSVGKPDHQLLNEMSQKFGDIFIAVMDARNKLIIPNGFLCAYGMKH